MSAEVIKSYLVSLSADTDMASFSKLEGTIKSAGTTVAKSVGGMVGDLLKFQIEATSAFAAVGFGIIGLIDHYAMLDQRQKLLAMQNNMDIKQYRDVAGALDVMGVSLEDVFHGTKQMQDQFGILIRDGKQMDALLGGDYEHQMAQVRDVIFQFDRLELKAQRFGMMFVSDLLKKMGFGEDGIGRQLERLNDWILEKMPQWSSELSTDIIPVLKDFWDIARLSGKMIWELASAFTNLVGEISGNTAIEGQTTSFHQFAQAIETVVHFVAKLLELMLATEHVALSLGGVLGHSLAGGLKALTGDFAGADAEDAKAHALVSELINRGAAGGASTPASALSGFLDSRGMASDNLIARVIHTESGGNANARSSVGAMGLMQLMPDTARQYGVTNPNDPAQNKAAGTAMLNDLLRHYGGNVDYALAAYNMGEGKLDSYMATGHYMDSRGRMASRIPDETMAYVKRITGDNLTVNVHVGTVNSSSPEHIAAAAKSGALQALQEHNRQQMLQLNGAYGN